jgi:hypothetical protein
VDRCVGYDGDMSGSPAREQSPEPIDWSTREPRTTGEIISDAISVLRRRFGAVYTLALPICAVDLVLRELSQSFLASISPTLMKSGGPSPDELLAAVPMFLAAMGLLATAFASQQILVGGVTVVAEQAFLGQQVSAQTAAARLLSRGAALLATTLLFVALVTGLAGLTLVVPTLVGGLLAVATEAFSLLIIGLALGLLGSLVVVLLLTLRWYLYAPAVLCEGLSWWRALQRSSSLTSSRGLAFDQTPRFRLSVMLLIALGISSVLQSLFVVPRLVVAAVTGWSFSDGGLPGLAHLPLWFGVPFGLIEVVTNAAVIPFSGILLALFSFDLRVRYEPT